jgi:hypothetical protein
LAENAWRESKLRIWSALQKYVCTKTLTRHFYYRTC